MSQALVICSRSPGRPRWKRDALQKLAARLLPPLDIIRPTARVVERAGIQLMIFPENEVVKFEHGGICLGHLLGEAEGWWRIGSAAPDGSYALYRTSETALEVLTDGTGSRTIWYVQTDDLFIAGSSQRAIVSLLTRFQPNRSAFSWMLAAGSIGPNNAWDERIRSIPPRGSLRLDRKSWQLSLEQQPVEFAAADVSEVEHRRRLVAALDETFDQLRLESGKWLLLLSGGVDSRAILLMLLKRNIRLDCITWGPASEAENPSSDVSIARRLAEQFKLKHEFRPPARDSGSAEKMFARLFAATEGRVDHPEGVWGMPLYEQLRHEGYSGLVRGDEGFGSMQQVEDERGVRLSTGLGLLSDYGDPSVAEELGFVPQILPDELQKSQQETLTAWRDRLYHTYRIPTVLAGLAGLWQPLLETVNPLLTRQLIDCARSWPEPLRTKKRLFLQVVEEMHPAIPFASHFGYMNPENRPLLYPWINDYVSDTLASREAARWLPQSFLASVVENLWWHRCHFGHSEKRNVRFLFKRLNRALYRRRYRPGKLPLNMNIERLASRALAICYMCSLLEADACFGRSLE